MVTDHSRLNDELGKAAKTAGLQVPTDLNAKQSSTQSPELKKAITDAIPVIKHHLDMAKTGAQKVGPH